EKKGHCERDSEFARPGSGAGRWRGDDMKGGARGITAEAAGAARAFTHRHRNHFSRVSSAQDAATGVADELIRSAAFRAGLAKRGFGRQPTMRVPEQPARMAAASASAPTKAG